MGAFLASVTVLALSTSVDAADPSQRETVIVMATSLTAYSVLHSRKLGNLMTFLVQ